MKFNKMLTPPIKALVILFFVQTAFAADGKWVQREGVGTGGTNWTEWTDANNWTGGVIAAGSTSHADLTASKGQYIRLPNETVSLKSIEGDVTSSSVLYGDALLQFGSPAADFKYIALYTPWKWSHNSVYSGPYGVSVCADCTYLYGNCLWFDTNRIRLDRYANSSDPVRVNACLPKDQVIKVNSTGGLVFMAPCGSSTNQTYTWSQTEGSKFLAPCAATGVLPVGAIVTGDGILPGTFLKRVFPDGTIELSTAVETTDTENELTFAPLRSDTTVRLGGYRGYNSSGLKFLIVEKYREEDDFRVEISYFDAAINTVANNGTFRLYTEDGFVPGVIALISDSAVEAVLKLENIRLEIDANYSGLQLTVPNDAAHEARVSVTGSLTKAVGRLSSVVGTFRKEGTGTLVVNELNAPVANLKVAEGALSVAAADEGLALSRLTIAAGARFDVPASGIFCEILDIGEGATIGGSGVLTYRTLAGGALPDIIVKGSAIVRAEVPEAAEFSVRVMNGAYTAYTKDGDDVLVFDSSATIAVAPEFRKEYDVIKGNRYFNAGIMLINVPELRKRRERMLTMLAERRLCYMECWDQGFFNELYKGEFDELPLTFNWKPYWGINDQAVIVHCHWMKPNKAWNDYDVMLHAMHLDLQGEAAQVGMLHYMRRFIAANCPDKVAFLDGLGSLFFKAEQRRRDLALENARRLFREADPREWLPKGKRTALDKIKRRIAKWLIASLRQD